jgi:U3 small nucleolar RNA-associated protein 12
MNFLQLSEESKVNSQLIDTTTQREKQLPRRRKKMVKIYQRYVLTSTFGVIVSPHSNILFDPSGKYAICGALESILIWGIRGGIIHATLCEGQSSPEEQKKLPIVCRLALSPDLQHLAAGYHHIF